MCTLTIGLPIYNGGEAAEVCIKSLLAQTFTDFQLVIFDNASTDGTSELCAHLASMDSRIKHVRHPKTLPQSENFRGVLMAANSPYFMWAADDDIWQPTFAEECIRALEADKNAVACCPQVEFAYPDGKTRLARGTFGIFGEPRSRVREYLHNPRDSSRLYGVYRTADLKASYPANLTMFGYDWLVVCLTFLYGDHIEIQKVLLRRSGHHSGKYFEKFVRHYIRPKGFLGGLSGILPLYPLTLELKRHLSSDVWKGARWRLVRLNLHQFLLLLRWRYPAFGAIFSLLRSVDRNLIK